MILNLLLLVLIITYVWDVLDFPNKIAGILTAIITNNRISTVYLKPPFGCSFCMVFWIAVVYLLLSNISLLPSIAIALLCSFLSKPTLYIITLLDRIIEKIFRYLEDAIN